MSHSYPTIKEDMELARSGKIRLPDGTIQDVGFKEAYIIIDKRKRSNFYNAPRDSEFTWKERPAPPKIAEAEELHKEQEPEEEPDEHDINGDENDVNPEPIPEKPSRGPEHPDAKPGFTRGNVIVSKPKRVSRKSRARTRTTK